MLIRGTQAYTKRNYDHKLYSKLHKHNMLRLSGVS